MSEDVKTKMERHLGASGELILNNEDGTDDIFKMEQLNYDEMPKLMVVAGSMKKNMIRVKDEDGKIEQDENGNPKWDVDLSKLTESEYKLLTDLIFTMVRRSFSQEVSDDDIKKFCMKNFTELMNVLVEINTP